MDVRCSILGHNYQETEVERDRERRGDEEVITIREFQECRRCGHRDLVSENKHVRSISVADADSDAAEAEATSDAAADEPAEEPPTDAGTANDDTDRDPGEWPEDETTSDERSGPEDPTAWPEHDGREDEGYSAEPSDGEAPNVEFEGGLTPQARTPPEDGGGEVLTDEDSSDEPQQYVGPEASDQPDSIELPKGDTSAGTTEPPGYVDMEYYCPNCGFSAGEESASLRTGDICPNCHAGYLGEREA